MGRFTNVTCGCQEISSVSPCLEFLPTTYTRAHFQHLLGRLFPSLPSLALGSISDRWTADIKKWNKNKNWEIWYFIEVEKLCIMLCPPASWTKEMDFWLWVTVRVIRILTVEVFFGIFQVIKVINEFRESTVYMIPVNRHRAHVSCAATSRRASHQTYMVLNNGTRSPATVFGLFCLEEVLGSRENQC